MQRAFRQAWGPVETLARNDPVRYGVGEPDGRRFWHTLVHATFSKLTVPEHFDDFFEELYQLFKQPTVWRLFPECLEVLHTLRQQGYMVGVISNWDIRLLELLQGMGLMTYSTLRGTPTYYYAGDRAINTLSDQAEVKRLMGEVHTALTDRKWDREHRAVRGFRD